MYNESTYFKFELYIIHVGSINLFGGSKVPIYWQRFSIKLVNVNRSFKENMHCNNGQCF